MTRGVVVMVVVGLNNCRGNEGEVSWLQVVLYQRIFQNVFQHVCEGLVHFPLSRTLRIPT